MKRRSSSCADVHYMFFQVRKLQEVQIQSEAYISMRKGTQGSITAGGAKTDAGRDHIIMIKDDNGYCLSQYGTFVKTYQSSRYPTVGVTCLSEIEISGHLGICLDAPESLSSGPPTFKGIFPSCSLRFRLLTPIVMKTPIVTVTKCVLTSF